MSSKCLLLCFALAGSVVVLAQAQNPNKGFIYPHDTFDPNMRKSIVCNNRGVCHYLDYGQTSYQKVPWKKDHWRRILRSSDVYNGPAEERTPYIDPMLTLQNHQFQMQKREQQTIKNEWARLKKDRFQSEQSKYPVFYDDQVQNANL